VGGVAFIITPHCASDGILISDRETDSPLRHAPPRASNRGLRRKLDYYDCAI